MDRRVFLICLVILATAAFGCIRMSAESDPAYPFTLTADEIELSRQLARSQVEVPAAATNPGERVYFVKAEVLPESRADSGRRHVMVTHYRYADDTTLLTLVDLGQRAVIKSEAFPHFPTGLAPEEIAHAVKLVHEDGRLQTLLTLANPSIEVVHRPLQISDPADPLHHHRLVQILLRQGNTFLQAPRVLVDLSTDTVHVMSE